MMYDEIVPSYVGGLNGLASDIKVIKMEMVCL